MSLDIGMLGLKELFGSFNSQNFNFVYVDTTAIIAAPGVSLSIFVGQHRVLGLKHCPAGMVFRGNKIYGACLPLSLQAQDLSYFAITLRQGKCLRGFQICAVIVLNILFLVNNKTH